MTTYLYRGGSNLSFAVEPLERRTLLASSLRFAVVGDYGNGSAEEAAVAAMVKSQNPNLIVTTGDNNYDLGEAKTIDGNIGQFYHDYIYPYQGSYGPGAADNTNHFSPSLGNHDWVPAGAQPYLDYFALPGNERYYTFTAGPVQFFAIDSDHNEANLGFTNQSTSTADSVEAQWLQRGLAASNASWKIVYFHHAPYSSGTTHGSSAWMQWPFEAWGANAVLAGHEHNYERIMTGGIPYFVNGSGGKNLYAFGEPVAGSKIRYNGDFGAMIVDATDTSISYQFITRSSAVIDTYSQTASGLPAPWMQTDIGRPAMSGSATYLAGTFAVYGAGQDILGRRDQFRFAYQALRGDGQIIARVGSIRSGQPRIKVGLMMRRSLRADSPYAAVMLSGGTAAVYQQRKAFAADTAFGAQAGIAAPYWLKMERRGNVFTTYISRFGRRWKVLGRANFSASTAYVGMAVSSGEVGALGEGVFDHVALSRFA